MPTDFSDILNSHPELAELQTIRIGHNLLPELVSIELGDNLAIVSDVNTHRVLGQAVAELVSDSSTVILPAQVTPSKEYVTYIREHTKNASALIAVGSGTINDLCKYVSHLDNKPYIILGTAPSMNGYASANASIIKDSKKQSFTAHLPRTIFLDLDILENAPVRLIHAGVGDSLCRPTAQADWLLSNLINNTNYNEQPFDLLTKSEEKLFANPTDIEALAETLILSGIGMTLCGGSHPASQGEHMLAHYIESGAQRTDYPEECEASKPSSLVDRKSSGSLQEQEGSCRSDLKNFPYHGEQIAITTLIMAELQAFMLNQENLDIPNWSNIRAHIQPITMPADRLRDILLRAGAPTTPQDIGWTTGMLTDALRCAHTTRDRYTFLNLPHEAGLMAEFIDNWTKNSKNFSN